MLTVDRYFKKGVVEYLNRHPAFNTTQSCIIYPDFFDKYISDALYHDKNFGVRNYQAAVSGYAIMDMESAKEFINWLDPRWCEYKGIKNSGFFKEQLELSGCEEIFEI